MFRKIFSRRLRPAPSCNFGDKPVTKQGLAYTPAELMQYQKKGIPVSAQSSESYFDGEANPSFDLAVDQLRGVDVVSCWEAQTLSRSRLANAHITDTKKFG